MRFLLDTDWIISFLNGRQPAVTLVTRLLSQGLSINVISYGEAYEGFLGSPESDWNLTRLDDFAALSQILQANKAIAARNAQLRFDLRARGQLISDNDLWIVATALTHDLTLVTRDKHFERVPGLKLYQQVR